MSFDEVRKTFNLTSRTRHILVLGGRKYHIRIGFIDLFFGFLLVGVFCVCTSDVLGCREALSFVGAARLLSIICLLSYSYCFGRRALWHGTWNTLCRHRTGLARRWRVAVAHPTISHHYTFSGHPESL